MGRSVAFGAIDTMQPNDLKVVTLEAAGGVVLRPLTHETYEVVVCGRSLTGLWALPKGKPNGDELPLATAVREVHEETGLRVTAGPLIDEVRYAFYRPADRALCQKVVRFFLMSPVGGDISEHDAEFDHVVWLPTSEAMARLTYENETRILEKALAMAKGPAGR